MGRGPQEYVEAACAILDLHGPAAPGLGMSAAAMAEAAQVSRSTVYRHWPTVGELNDDLALHAAIDAEGWQRSLLRQPVDAPLVASITAAVDAEAEVGIWVRCALGSWPEGARVRTETAAWEEAWIETAGAWLTAHLSAHGRHLCAVAPRVAVLALTALVDGRLLLDQIWSQPGTDAWYTGRAVDLGHVVARLVDHMTEPTHETGSTSPPSEGDAPLPRTPTSPAKRALLERATVAYHEAKRGDPEALDPGRLVDTGRLARRLEVSERRLYDVWPTATDANVDVVTALGERAVAAFAAVARQMMAEAETADPHLVLATPAVVASYQSYVETAIVPDRAHMLRCTSALVDAEVWQAFIDTTARAAGSMRTTFLALLYSTGRQLLPEVSLDEYLGCLRAVVGGAQRLAITHPGLAGETTTYRGDDVPVAGLLCQLVVSSAVTTGPPSSAPTGRGLTPSGR